MHCRGGCMSGRNSSKAVIKSAPLVLSPAFSVRQGFHAIVGNCLRQIQGNEAGVAHGKNPESVHQMRVGVRRLRTALKLFGRWIPFPPRLQSELDWLSRQLGCTRNWEVLSGTTLVRVSTEQPLVEPSLNQLRQSAAQVAARQRQRTAALMEAARYARFRGAITAWVVQVASAESDSAMSGLLGPCAVQVLARNHAKLLKRGKRLRAGDAQSRHRLRIAAKKVRYAAEFFCSLYPERRMNAFIASLAALQEVLGRLNDAAVADGLLDSLTKKCTALTESAVYVRSCLARDSKRDLHALDKVWRRFAKMKLPKPRKQASD